MANIEASADHSRTIPVSTYLASLFNLRWVLGRVGYDPCDEWDADEILGLPEGLSMIDGTISFECRSCERWTEWPAAISEFELGHYANVCGGSPRCCP